MTTRTREERKAAIALTRQTLDENGFQNTLVIAGTGAQSLRETDGHFFGFTEQG